MERFKDFLYNISDIIFGMFILLIIVGYVFFNVRGYFSQIFFTYKSDNSIEMAQSDLDELEDEKILSEENDYDKLSFDDDEREKVKFKIKEDMTVDQVASLLKKKGLIESKEDFINCLKEQNLDKSIQPGDFAVVKNPKLKDLVKRITMSDNKE